ncbi:hypothetical protein ACFV2X_41060 [Streptomyces sp. NPDC059679]|uniref:hypothetical protein n=1 Tax=Streptomyces sp. NPDC059679 TaxID=3346903 RepID=UPI0036CA2C73
MATKAAPIRIRSAPRTVKIIPIRIKIVPMMRRKIARTIMVHSSLPSRLWSLPVSLANASGWDREVKGESPTPVVRDEEAA